MPSDVPSVKTCESTDGVFGDVDGTGVTVEFAYELEANTTEDVIESDVLPVLEQAFVDSILSEVFASECSSTRRLRVANRRLQVSGVSKYPLDSILEDGKKTEILTNQTRT